MQAIEAVPLSNYVPWAWSHTCIRAEQINSFLQFLSYSKKYSKGAGSDNVLDTARQVSLHTAPKHPCNYGCSRVMGVRSHKSVVPSVK